jgi:nanoRNase/pAp phosphatase (c-di-AMP/oligoRNAs hydrolase)
MATRMNNQNFQKAVELINKSTGVLITTHTKVDGDAVGCCVAMSEVLSVMGKNPQILFLAPLPD